MYERRDGRWLHSLLIAQARSGVLSPEQAARVADVFSSRAAQAPMVAIVQAPETWRWLSATFAFEDALYRFATFLGADIDVHREMGTMWARVQSESLRGAFDPLGRFLLQGDPPRVPPMHPDHPIWGIDSPYASLPVDAGRFHDVCPCCVRSELAVKKVRDFSEHGLNKLEFEIKFDLGIASRDDLHDCELEWWECPSKEYLARGGGLRAFVQADRWTNLSRLYEASPGAADWRARTTELKKLCERGDSNTRVPIRITDTPGIVTGRDHARDRRYLNIEVRIKSGDRGGGLENCPEQRIARILVIQSNDRKGNPNRGQVKDLGKRGRYRTLTYRGDPWGKEAPLLPGVAAGP